MSQYRKLEARKSFTNSPPWNKPSSFLHMPFWCFRHSMNRWLASNYTSHEWHPRDVSAAVPTFLIRVQPTHPAPCTYTEPCYMSTSTCLPQPLQPPTENSHGLSKGSPPPEALTWYRTLLCHPPFHPHQRGLCCLCLSPSLRKNSGVGRASLTPGSLPRTKCFLILTAAGWLLGCLYTSWISCPLPIKQLPAQTLLSQTAQWCGPSCLLGAFPMWTWSSLQGLMWSWHQSHACLRCQWPTCQL